MNWMRLAVRGLRHRPARTLVTVAGVAIAIAGCFGVLAFQSGYRRSLAFELDRLGAHILVVPKGCPYDAASLALHGANWPCRLRAAYLDEVRGAPGVAVAAPVYMAAFADRAGVPIVYAGIDEAMTRLKPGWRVSGRLPRQPGELLAGASAAARWGWRLGDRVRLPGLPGDRKELVEVCGVLAPTQGPDDRFLFLPLADAQQRFGHPGEITHILVSLREPERMAATVSALRGCDAGMQMNVVPLAHLFETIQSLVNATRWFLAGVTLVGLAAAAAGVSAAILIAVAERTREIGVMRSLGAGRADIFRLFWLETMAVCLAGGVAGVTLAAVGLGRLETWLRAQLPFVPEARLLEWEWWVAGACMALAVGLGCGAGLLPAWRAARLPPAVAFRLPGGN